LGAFIRGEHNDLNRAIKEASLEWAALQPPGGTSRYNGIAGNYASVPPSQTAAAIQRAREAYLRGVTNSPEPSEGNATIVDVGKTILGFGLTVAEHPAFDKQRGYVGKGARVGGHTDGSLHYSDKAIDITDWRVPGEPKPVWQARKAALVQVWRPIAQKYGLELLGPGDPGHEEHIHLGLPSGQIPRLALAELRRGYDQVMRNHPLRR
jgi:hypothetical protein